MLRQDGHQLPHIHASGWLSGVYYAQLPDSAPGGDDHAGWIEFGRPGYDLPATGAQVRAIAPEVGRLLFFPSYFFHRTIPFRGDRPRVSVAFDLAPLAYR